MSSFFSEISTFFRYPNYSFIITIFLTKSVTMSRGTGNTIVLLFSAEMLLRVWRYRSCNLVICEEKNGTEFALPFLANLKIAEKMRI